MVCDPNRNGWKQIYWGTKSDWNDIYLSTPMWKGPNAGYTTTDAGTNTTGTNRPLRIGTENMHPFFPRAVPPPNGAQLSVGYNALLHVIHSMTIQVANNQEYPVYLTVYKVVAKENGDNNNHLPLDALQQSITEMEHFNLYTETQDETNLLFSMKDLNKTNALNTVWKFKGRQKVKLNPGDVAKISMSDNFKIKVADWVNFSSQDLSFLAGRIHGFLFKLQGPLGKHKTYTTPSFPSIAAGYLGANVQIAEYHTWKSRFESTTIPRIFTWEQAAEAAAPTLSDQFTTDGKAVYPSATDGVVS